MLCFLLAAALGAASPAQVREAEVRQAAARSVALLQKVGAEWKAQCISCHHQALPAMALAVARQHGVPVDEQAARRAAGPFAFFGALDIAVQGAYLIDPAISDGYALLGAHAAGIAPNLSTAVYARRTANWQSEDGHWRTVDGRPPHSSSLFTTTAIASRAIDLYLPAQLAAERGERVAKARAWLLSSRPQSTEDRAFQLLGLGWTGASAEDRKRAAVALMGEQRPDGGWPQTAGLASDAYSTGQALVALRQAGMLAPGSAVYQAGLRFLLKTQAADGSWLVKTRLHSPAPISPPYFETGFPYRRDQVISCAGSAWAAMALMEALPVVASAPAPPPVPQAVPAVEPWMETALFGTAEQLRALLDGGLDPNRATAGGTTLLMMAAADAAKVKLLMDRGADPRRASQSGYTPLLIASMYRGKSASVKLLLGRGAEIAPARKALFNINPLGVASMAGDAETAGLLLARGADLRRPMLLAGVLPLTPLGAAVGMNDLAMVRFLLSRGAQVDEVDQSGMTPLGWAALMHHTDMARLLLESGANPGHVDKWGYTPLRHTEDIAHADPQTAVVLRNSTRTTASR